MKKETMKTLRAGSKIGALAGGVLFAVFGIVPGFYFGSYGTLSLLTALAGGPVEPGLVFRAAIVVGTMLGLFCMAAVSVVTGAVAGTALGYLAEAVWRTRDEEAKAATN